MSKVQMTELEKYERSRTYQFPGGETVRFEKVTHVGVRPSGSHRLKTLDGLFHIVAAGWLAIHLDIDDWSF